MEGEPVRAEYEALARHFGDLAGLFGWAVDDAVARDLRLVAAAFEVIDRRIDAIADPVARRRMAARIAGRLDGGEAGGELPADLADRLTALRARLGDLGALAPFVASLRRFFRVTDRLRQTTRAGAYLRCTLGEARCAARMVLLVLPASRPRAFDPFFVLVSEAANLADKIQDAPGDRRRGEIALAPGPAFYARLAIAFARRAARLLVLAPRPLGLVRWGARFVAPAPIARAPASSSQ